MALHSPLLNDGANDWVTMIRTSSGSRNSAMHSRESMKSRTNRLTGPWSRAGR